VTGAGRRQSDRKDQPFRRLGRRRIRRARPGDPRPRARAALVNDAAAQRPACRKPEQAARTFTDPIERQRVGQPHVAGAPRPTRTVATPIFVHQAAGEPIEVAQPSAVMAP